MKGPRETHETTEITVDRAARPRAIADPRGLRGGEQSVGIDPFSEVEPEKVATPRLLEANPRKGFPKCLGQNPGPITIGVAKMLYVPIEKTILDRLLDDSV